MKSLLLIPIFNCFLPCVIGSIKLDIPEEIYPPKFLTQIKKGKVPYYANDADLQKYHAWLSEFLASDVMETPINEKTTKEQFDRNYPKPLKGHSKLSEISAAAGGKCSAFYEAIVNSTADEIREMSLGRLRIFCLNDDDSVNSSLPRSFWSKINGTFCTVKRECSGSNGAGRKTSIVCADHNAEFYPPLTHLEESDFGCKNSPLEMIQVSLPENSQKEIKTRYELSWGRFHCPSEITCLEELLFDFGTFFNHQQNEVTKWLLNTFIFLIVMFFTKEICDRLL